jgi:hypothetical protein
MRVHGVIPVRVAINVEGKSVRFQTTNRLIILRIGAHTTLD